MTNSSGSLSGALSAVPSRSALQQHAASALSLTASLTLPSAAQLATLLAQAEQRSSQASRNQQHAKQQVLAHLQLTSQEDRALGQTLAALPDQINSADEAILALSSPAVLALEQSLLAQLQARTKLQTARDYFHLLASAEDLRVQALNTTHSDGRNALRALSKLAHLSDQAEDVLQDARIRGLSFIRAQRDFAFHELRKRAITKLRSACEEAGWSPASASAGTASSEPNGKPPIRRLDADPGVQAAWKDLCRFQRTAEKLHLMPCATAPLLQTDSLSEVEEEQPKDSAEVQVQSSAPRPGSAEYVPLLAVTVLLDVLLLRFRYHFDSSRPSNRLDKPEWYLSHILGLVRAYGLESDLFRPGTGSVARLCALGGWGRAHGVVPSKTSKGNGIPEKMLDTGAELLHGLLVPLRAKLVASMPLLLPHPPLLAHTISEYIIFDDALRTTYPPSNLSQPDTARGPALSLADQVLNNSDWFAAWLEGERAHAEERLDEILNAGDAWAIQAADGVEDEEDALVGGRRGGEELASGPVQRFPTQPTTTTTKGAQESTNATGSRTTSTFKTVRSAQQIIELLDSIQDRASPLPLLTHRLAFFARIQLPLLRAYADRLTRSLDAFESLSHAFARAMPGAIEGVNLAVAGAGGANVSVGGGVDLSSGGGGNGVGDVDMVKGLRGLGRLLKAHLSAAYIVDTLTSYNETPYFLSLSSELRQTDEGRKLGVELAVAEDEAEEAELDKASLVSLLRKSLRRQGNYGSGVDIRGRGAEFVAAAGAKIRSRSASRTRENSAGGGAGGGGGGGGGVEGAGVWDDILIKYRGLLRRATVAMERLVVHEIVDALKPYSYRRWDEGQIEEEDEDNDNDEDEEDEKPARVKTTTGPREGIPTPSLLPALTLLSTHLGHLLPALPPHYALPVYRSIAGTLSTAIVDRVVMSGGAHRFTYAGGQRFARDVEGGWFGVISDLMHTYGGRALSSSPSARLEAAQEAMGRRPRAAWRELEGVGKLLSLPPTLPGAGEKRWTLERTTRALFEEDGGDGDGEDGWGRCRRELGMEGGGSGGLTVVRAREVVRRRIE
ncbi:hypothetical protein CF336_g2659, partial [Tilletia laevis]